MLVGFIGTGNMGSAIMKGAFQNCFLKPYETFIYDVNEEQVKKITDQFPVRVAQSNMDLARQCDVIILAVKPAYMRNVLAEILKFTHNKRVISIAAGWTMGMLMDILGRDTSVQILRVMPNTPALVGEGYTALCEETTFNRQSIQWAKELFSTLGAVQVLPERLFDAVVAVSGSSPAYVYMLIEAMADGAVRLGMPRKLALQAAAQSVYGAAKMVLSTGEHPSQLRDNVCSPGGTTIDAVYTLEKDGFRAAVIEAMEVCAEKNRRIAAAHDRRSRI